MIQIFSSNGKLIRSWSNDGEFFNHINAGELLEGHPEVGATHWSLIIFPPERVPDLCLNLEPKPAPSSLKEAYEQQLGVIEICRGDYASPIWIPLEPVLNIGTLKKDWYLECCEQHGYALTEAESGQ